MRQILVDSWVLQVEGRTYQVGPSFDLASVLIEQKVLPHPYLGDQELLIQDLGRTDFSAETSFDWPGEHDPSQKTYLYLPSIDCLASVELNGQEIGKCDNAFHPWVFPVQGLRPGKNQLRLGFRGPVNEGEERQARAPYPYPHSVYPIQSPYRNMLRKVQCHSGWDWGPSVATSGVYQTVRLETSSWARPLESQVRVIPPTDSSAPWKLELRLELESWTNDLPARLGMELIAPEGKEIEPLRKEESYLFGEGRQSLIVELEVEDPELWWPAGMGDQHLYRFNYELDLGPKGQSVRAHEESKGIGFRKLEHISQEDDYGKSFYFRVNGREFFAKGANWIPTDALPEAQTRERTRSLLESARDAQMNMIRVWGGGQYESEYFYDSCDELGLLIWQDFMFACGTYPADPAFLSSVEREVRFQIGRLCHRSSIAIWCGNNETLGSLGWYLESRKERDRYLVDYDRLYEGCVGRVIRELDPGRSFWPSSPSGGSDDYTDGWHDDSRGDMHFWSVWHEGKPFNAYLSVIPRFCSEFGFQSYPSAEGISRAMPEVASGEGELSRYPGPGDAWAGKEEWNLTGRSIDHHQKNARGNTIIMDTMFRSYRVPGDLAEVFYMSQVQQQRAFETAVDFWRSQAPRSMGALYWQLNDLWPVASWSSIEYPDKWKLTHYGAQRFFEPLRIALIRKDPETPEGQVPRRWSPVKAVLLNDTGLSLDLELSLRLVNFDGESRDILAGPLKAGPEMARELAVLDPEELGIDGRDFFVHARLIWKGIASTGARAGRPSAAGIPLDLIKSGTILSQGSRFFCLPKYARMREPGIKLEWSQQARQQARQQGKPTGNQGRAQEPNQQGNGHDKQQGRGPGLIYDQCQGLELKLSVQQPAFNIFLDSPGPLGRWSSNNECLLPGEDWYPRFLVRKPSTWSSALISPRDEALLKDWEAALEHSCAAEIEILKEHTRIHNLHAAGILR